MLDRIFPSQRLNLPTETQPALGYSRPINSRALPKTRLAASFPLGGCSSWDLSISKSSRRQDRSYPCTNGTRGDPISSLAVGAAVGTTIAGCRSTHQGKIPKTSFLWLTSPFTLTKITAVLCQLLRIHQPNHSCSKPERPENSGHGTG